jgi:hypothetical protein
MAEAAKEFCDDIDAFLKKPTYLQKKLQKAAYDEIEESISSSLSSLSVEGTMQTVIFIYTSVDELLLILYILC